MRVGKLILKFPSKARHVCFNEKRNIFTVFFIDFSGRISQHFDFISDMFGFKSYQSRNSLFAGFCDMK